MQKVEIERACEDQKRFWALIKQYNPRNFITDSISPPPKKKKWHDYCKELLHPSIGPVGCESSKFSEFVSSYQDSHDNTCVNCHPNEEEHQEKLLKQLNRPIHESEIREQNKKAQRSKSPREIIMPGADGILNELIKLAKEN